MGQSSPNKLRKKQDELLNQKETEEQTWYEPARTGITGTLQSTSIFKAISLLIASVTRKISSFVDFNHLYSC